jgi:hypothetical protein
MARVIVLSFEDNESAEMFAKALLREGPTAGRPFVPPSAKIEAMIARPTAGCRGPHRIPGKIKSEHGFSRTKRFGWFVCGQCKKPAQAVVDRFIENMLGGSNDLLPEVLGSEPKQPRWLAGKALVEVQTQLGRR